MDGSIDSLRGKEKCRGESNLFPPNKKEVELSKTILEAYAKGVDEGINKKLFKELIEKYSEVVDELQEKIEKIEEMSMIDTLTGIYNRKTFLKEFELEVKRSERKNKSMTLAILDIDHFKKVNDTYGHETGDIDVFARWGGEEFVIVLGDTLEESLPSEMFSKADEALYRAKKNGRNRIEVWKKS